METLWCDVRYSVRTLLKRPRFTATVVLTLALGIGANATIFTWIKALLLTPLPGVAQPDQLVEIWGATQNNSALSNSYVDYLDLRDRNEALSGVVAHQILALISQRLRELGIRIAIGAQRRDLLVLILGQGLALSVIGIISGVLMALMATRLLAHSLYGVSATDPVTFMVVALLLLVVALVAGYVPARRATKIDPIVALRLE
jgi:hypothetical protein